MVYKYLPTIYKLKIIFHATRGIQLSVLNTPEHYVLSTSVFKDSWCFSMGWLLIQKLCSIRARNNVLLHHFWKIKKSTPNVKKMWIQSTRFHSYKSLISSWLGIIKNSEFCKNEDVETIFNSTFEMDVPRTDKKRHS